jgi:hypothetical protein
MSGLVEKVFIAGLALAIPMAYVQAGTLQSLKVKKQQAEWTEALKESVSDVNEKCGTKIEISIDAASFEGKVEGSYSVPGYCEAPFTALRDICDTKEGIEAAKKLRKFECRYGGKDKRSLSVKDGTLTWTVDWESANDSYYAKDELEKQL